MHEQKNKMKTKNRISWDMILYEIRNILGNPFIYIFGLGLPIFMSLMMSKVVTQGMTDTGIIRQVTTTVFLGNGLIIPMATMLIGYSAVYSQEIEKGIPLRMRLFGFSENYILINRMIAEFLFMTVALFLYFMSNLLFLPLAVPTKNGLFLYLLCVYVFGMLLFLLAHAVSGLIRKFGPTYAVTMLLYFVMMIFGGLMGMSYQSMPKLMQAVARMIPVTYITRDFYEVWCGEAYNCVPMLQSYLFFAAVSGILLFVCIYKQRRRV